MNTSAPQNTTKIRNDKVNQNIQVYCRVRPLNTRERMMRSHEIVEVSLPKDIICRHMITKKFSFDRTFGPESKQSEVYHTVVAPLIEEVLSGYNCTVFAYGQTGTGKTHTMVGVESPELKSSWEDDSSVGIIPRALCHMLDELRLMEVEYTMRISYLELYNEELCDLLSTDDSVKIRIFDDSTKKGSVIIQGLEEVIVHGKDDVYKLLEKGQERRKTATTLMNAQSSRSHTVFSILIHIKENGIDGEEMLKIGKLNLVDLAGSENISKAGNEKGIRTRETVNINQSLLTLGRVITSLVERAPHVPYRESKLTRLLQESLGGRTKTSIIATISPGHKDIDETLSTLEYAHRAKNIQNKPEINQKLTKKTVLKEYTEEIDRLKRDLMAARDKNGIYLAEDTYNEMHYKLENQNKELNEKILMLKAMKEEMNKKEALFNEVSTNLAEKTEELERTEKVLNEAKYALTQTKKVLNTTKKRYKEKKIILGSHIKTEEKLANQATELIKVADIATNDHILLQETLERRKNIDVEIKNVAGEFKNRMESSLHSMNRNMEELKDKHKSISGIVTDEIYKNSKTINSYINNAKSKIANLASYCESDFDKFYSLYDNCATEILIADEVHRSSLDELYKLQKEKDEKWKNELKTNLNETIEILKEQQNIHEKNMTLLTKLISVGNEKDHTFFEILNHHLSDIIKEASRTITEERSKMKEYADKGSQLIKKKNDIFSQMEKLMCNLKELEAEDSNRISDIEKFSENLLTMENGITSSINSEIKSIEDFEKTKDNDVDEIKNNFTNFDGEYKQNAVKAELKINYFDDALSTFHIHNSDFNNKTIKMSQDNEENRSQLLEINKNQILNEKTKSFSMVETERKETENIVFQIQSNFNEHSLQTKSLTKSLDDSINEYANTFNQKVEENLNNLEDFYQNELKTYTPTGQTPSKKDFSYPKVLARTSPHTNIIKRFRLENDYSDLDISNSTISEENESTIIEMDDLMPRRSTPIKLLENTSKSLDLNTQSLTENNSRLTHSLNIYDCKRNFSDIKTSSPAIYTTMNKENIG